MAHLFKQMYVDEIDCDALTVEKLIDLVFTEMVYRKIQQLEKKHWPNVIKLMVINGQGSENALRCLTTKSGG